MSFIPASTAASFYEHLTIIDDWSKPARYQPPPIDGRSMLGFLGVTARR